MCTRGNEGGACLGEWGIRGVGYVFTRLSQRRQVMNPADVSHDSQRDAGSVVNTMRASLTTLRNPLMSRVVSTDPVATSTHPSREAG